MSMFDNIVFDEFTLLEGEQAEAYKKRKQIEKNREHVKDIERPFNYIAKKALPAANNTKEADLVDKEKEYTKRIRTSPQGKALEKQEKHSDGDFMSLKNQKILSKGTYAIDAIDRHDRRHGKSNKQKVAESMIAAYESEFAY